MPITQATPESVRGLLLQTAPKKQADLEKLFDKLRPTFWGDTDTEGIVFKADSATSRITAGMRGIARLQAHALAGTICFLLFLRRNSIPREIVLERSNAASYLIAWAVRGDLLAAKAPLGYSVEELEGYFAETEFKIPPNLLNRVTSEEFGFGLGLYTNALAFILLHELAHLENGDVTTTGEWSIRAEQEADYFALQWLLDGHPGIVEAGFDIGRANVLLGSALALLWPTFHNIWLGPKSGRTHPQAYDRLFHTLNRGVDPSNEHESFFVWYFVSRMLEFHLRLSGFSEEAVKSPHTDYRETASFLIDKIANSGR